MGMFVIDGGRALHGTVHSSGAKNAVLPMLAACVACGTEYCFENCPDLLDVDSTLDILRHLGCRTNRDADRIYVDTRPLCRYDIPKEQMQRLRSSLIFLGPLLARCRAASIFAPGGCSLGLRPIDLHLSGLEQLGVQCSCDGAEIHCRAAKLQGAAISLAFPSVGATQNLMLAALGCDSPVTICNAAQEPEVQALGHMLQKMGADVYGAGSSVVRISAQKPLHGARCRIIPDRIETATYLCAALACGGDLCMERVIPGHLRSVLACIQQTGARVDTMAHSVRVQAEQLHAPQPIRTAPYPGFPTDAQAVMMAALLRAQGSTILEETIFENRFRHVPALQAMGAEIHTAGRIAVINGAEKLHGADVTATDLRGGAAMIVAALGVQGRSRITDTGHIHRGYASLPQKLQALGAKIEWREDAG